MTIADSHSAAALRRIAGGRRSQLPVEVSPPPTPPAAPETAAARWLVVAWDVADEGLRGVLEWRVLEVGSGSAADLAARAVWRPEDGEGKDGGAERVLAALAQNPGTVIRSADPTRGLEHIDIPGLLAVTVRRAGEGAEVLYARTSALGTLGVRGGRADCPRGEVVVTTAATDGPPERR